MRIRQTSILLPTLFLSFLAFAQQPSINFMWPDGKRAALSLSFDDARQSQVDVGVALLDKHKVKWVVLAGHEIGQDGQQTTRVTMLDRLTSYADDPANKIWIAPVGTIAKYIRGRRGGK